MTTHTLDAKDLTCPLPVLRARKAMKHLAPGDILEVAATDPAAVRDFPAFCEATGQRAGFGRTDGGRLYLPHPQGRLRAGWSRWAPRGRAGAARWRFHPLE